MVALLQKSFPALEADLNPEKPRKGAFNISASVGGGSAEPTLLWDGRSKGPPRKEKWPEDEMLVNKIKELIK